MDCDQYTVYYYDFLMTAGKVPEAAARHLASCEVCRQRMEELKTQLGTECPIQAGMDKLLALQMRLLDRWVSCQYCKLFLPFLLVRKLRLRVDTPVLGHVENCPACRDDLKAIESLHLTDGQLLEAAAWLAGEPGSRERLRPDTLSVLKEVADRPDSTVLTRSSLDPAEDQVSVLKTVTRDLTAQPVGGATAGAFLRHWGRPISAAAAVLFVAAFLYFQATPAQGFSLKRLYQTVQQIHTACIKSYYPEEDFERAEGWNASGAARKEICVSDPLGLILYKTADEAVLVDQLDGVKYVRENGVVVREPSTDLSLIRKPWGLLPFNSLSQLPPGYNWKESDVQPRPNDGHITVYDLTWAEGTVQKLWRGFLNAEGLPVRIEFWDKMPNRSAALMMVMEIDYPSLEQVKEVIRREGFQNWDDQIREQ